jgi:broad specificity phosphatase PhoE
MRALLFITHPEVAVDPKLPVTEWGLSSAGRARMQQFAAQLAQRDIRTLFCSRERKASQAADLLAQRLSLAVQTDEELGENDRSATGYLPPERFEATADAFFANPERSMDGWERAVDAQRRIVAAIARVIERSAPDGDIAVVSHGAVGTLLLCHLQGIPISRAQDQPSQGHWFAFECATGRVLHGWRPLV